MTRVRKDKQGNWNVGRGFWKLRFGVLGLGIIIMLAGFVGFIITGLIVGEPNA